MAPVLGFPWWGDGETVGQKLTVRHTDLDRWLSNNGGRSLVEVLAPLNNRKLVDAEKDAYQSHYWHREIRNHLGDRTDERWLEWLRSSGKLVQPNYFDDLRHASRILELLPADGISLTELAEQATGDTKALSRKQLASIVLYALSLEHGSARPDSVEAERALWDAYGVVVDTLSSQVMVLGVRAEEDHLIGRFLNQSADIGAPVVLTLDQLSRYSLTPTAGPIFVCENPAVLAAAARQLGAHCPALLCTQGQPSAAARRLLGFLSKNPIHWRGDFDWTGVRTTKAAIRRYGAAPWLMDADTYRTAANRGPAESFKVGDQPCEVTWDPDLASTMRSENQAVMEERIIPELLASLRAVRA